MFNTKTLALTGAALLALSLSACSQSNTTTTQNSAPSPATSQAQNLGALASGTFSGRSDHITTGLVTLVKTSDGYYLEFADDFTLDGAPGEFSQVYVWCEKFDVPLGVATLASN